MPQMAKNAESVGQRSNQNQNQKKSNIINHEKCVRERICREKTLANCMSNTTLEKKKESVKRGQGEGGGGGE